MIMMSASLRKRIEEFAQDFGFMSFEYDDGELTFFTSDPNNPKMPCGMYEFTKDSDIRKRWAELQSDLESEN